MAYDGEIADDIIAYALREGVEISSSQLKYWREAHALPYSGKTVPRGRGRTGLYPYGAARQAVALKHFLDEGKDLKFATWQLWLVGYCVGEQWTQRRIVSAIEQFDADRCDLTKYVFDPSGQAFSDRALDWLDSNPRLYNDAARLCRKLVGTHRFGTLLFHMLRVALGHPVPTATEGPDFVVAEDHDVIVTGLGFDRLSHDRLPGTDTVSRAQIIDILNVLAARLKVTSFADQASRISEQSLLQAAREIEEVIRTNTAIFEALKELFGNHAFGRGHLARLFRRWSNDGFVILTGLWAVVRDRFVHSTGRDQFGALESAATLLQASQRFHQFMVSSPALSSIWTPTFLRMVWRTSKTDAQCSERLRAAVLSRLILTIRAKPSD